MPSKQIVMNFIIKHKFTFIGVAVGALGGFMYYYFVGCASGTCAITSKPINSTLYGSVMGGLLASIIKGDKKQNEDRRNKSCECYLCKLCSNN